MHPDDELLAGLAIGEPVDQEVVAHIASCRHCQAEVAELREVASLIRSVNDEDLSTPPTSVWDAVSTELDLDERQGTPASSSAAGDARNQTGDLLAERRAATLASGGRGRSARWVLSAAAAALGILIGVGVGARLANSNDSDTTVVAKADLATLDTVQVLGTADLVRADGVVTLQVHPPELQTADGYLEVWLINRDLKRMISVGVLDGRPDQGFDLPQSLIDNGYVIVDISKEPFDDKPEHSGDTVVRGTLA